MSDSDDVNCGSGGGSDTYFGLRIASVFIIWAGSSFGAMFPVLAKRTSLVNPPKWLFECVFLSSSFFLRIKSLLFIYHHSFAKYFGSGVIVRIFFGLYSIASVRLGTEMDGDDYRLARRLSIY